MLSHATLQAFATVANPYTVLGVTGMLRVLRPDLYAEPQPPAGPHARVIGAEASVGRNGHSAGRPSRETERLADAIIRGIESGVLRPYLPTDLQDAFPLTSAAPSVNRTKVHVALFFTAATLLLPVTSAAVYHLQDAIHPVLGVLGDLGIFAVSHLMGAATGLLCGILTLGEAKRQSLNAEKQLAPLRVWVGGSVGRLLATFGTSYLMTSLLE